MKGCAVISIGGFGAFVLGLLLLFAMAGGGSADGDGGSGGLLNTSKVPSQYVSWVLKAGTECTAVSAPQIAAQIQQESGWNPKAVSPAGAEGIAQFMPGTWPNWGQDDDDTGNVSPFNPNDAIMAMGRYDCAIAKQVAGVPGDAVGNMLAGYNAGAGAVLKYNGIPPYAQTEAYVADIEEMIPEFELALGVGPSGSSAFAQAELAAAEKYIGTPYVWGGGDSSGPTGGGFDCSGLVRYAVFVASKGKLYLPHSSEDMAVMGTPETKSSMQPGDVIAIQTEGPGDYSHVVIYIGGGEIIEAPHTGAYVRIAPLSEYDGMTQTIRRFG
jgi:cell wall-associated NlpC family hydrolase